MARRKNPTWDQPFSAREKCMIDLVYWKARSQADRRDDLELDYILGPLLVDCAKSYDRQAFTASGFLPPPLGLIYDSLIH